MISILLSLGIGFGQKKHVDQVPQASYVPIYDQIAIATPPPIPPAAYPPEVATWSGWGQFIQGSPTFPGVFPGVADWAPLLGNPSTPAPGAPHWKVKVIVINRVDGLLTRPDGLLAQRRGAIESSEFADILTDLARAKLAFEKENDEGLNVDYTFSIEDEPYSFQCPSSELDSPAIRNIEPLVRGRINGGAFVADDKIYRGPFNAVLVIWPMFGQVDGSRLICETPVFELSTLGQPAYPGLFAERVLRDFNDAATFQAHRDGFKIPAPSLNGDSERQGMPLSPAWKSTAVSPAQLTATVPLGPEQYSANQSEPELGRPIPGYMLSKPGVSSPNCELTVTKDKTVGSALHVKLTGLQNWGGFVLPNSSSPDTLNRLKSGSYLVFSMRTKSPDPLSIGLANPHGWGQVCTLGLSSSEGHAAAVPADGQWHSVAVSFKGIADLANDMYSAIAIGYGPQDQERERSQVAPTEADFANFRIEDTIPGDAVPLLQQAPAPEDRKLAAEAVSAVGQLPDAAATKSIEATLQGGLDSPKLNALNALISKKDPDLESAIIGATPNINPRIVEYGIKALAALGTDGATAYLNISLQHGITAMARAEAGYALAASHDADLAGPLSTLLAVRGWRARVMACDALAELGGDQVGLMLTPFLADLDPMVRLAAIEDMPMTSDDGMKKVLFNSVNDPIDEVRAQACMKLLKSSSEDFKAQGLRGFTDDSVWVRAIMLSHAKELAVSRDVVLKSLADPCDFVRVAAIDALASMGPITDEELAPVAQDPRDTVQSAIKSARGG